MKKGGKRPQPQGPSGLQEPDEEEEQQRLQVRFVAIRCGAYRAIIEVQYLTGASPAASDPCPPALQIVPSSEK